MCFAVSPLRTAARSSSIPPCTIFAKAAPRPARSCAHSPEKSNRTGASFAASPRREPSDDGGSAPNTALPSGPERGKSSRVSSRVYSGAWKPIRVSTHIVSTRSPSRGTPEASSCSASICDCQPHFQLLLGRLLGLRVRGAQVYKWVPLRSSHLCTQLCTFAPMILASHNRLRHHGAVR